MGPRRTGRQMHGHTCSRWKCEALIDGHGRHLQVMQVAITPLIAPPTMHPKKANPTLPLCGAIGMLVFEVHSILITTLASMVVACSGTRLCTSSRLVRQVETVKQRDCM